MSGWEEMQFRAWLSTPLDTKKEPMKISPIMFLWAALLCFTGGTWYLANVGGAMIVAGVCLLLIAFVYGLRWLLVD